MLVSRPLIAVLFLAVAFVAGLASPPPASAIESAARQALLVEMATGAVLFEKDADELMHPASMSKMMTIYMVFERLRDGRLSLDDALPVSENAWRKGGAKSGGSTMFLDPGSRVKLEDLIHGIIVQSGNDACIVVAEALSGSEEAFAAELAGEARQLGLQDTTLRNATGWPHPEHLTTARDLAILARKTIEDFPDYYHFYTGKVFTYNGIRQTNRNPLLYRDVGADGLKTGHTEASGYGLTASATRGDRRLILVVNGLSSVKERAREAERLMAWGFREFENYALLKAGEMVTDAEVWLGQDPTVPLMIENDLTITLPRKARREMKVTVRFDGPVPAPVRRGTPLATLSVAAPGRDPVEVPLVAGADVEQLGVVGRLGAALRHIVWGQSN